MKEMDRGVEGIQLTRWKQTLASNILDTPLFSTLDLNEYPRKTWFEVYCQFTTVCLTRTNTILQMIVRKFTNYRNQVYLKSSDRVSTTALSTKKANPLLKFSSVISGRQLFAQENSESLTAASKQRVDDTDHKSLAAVYQIILKERWDSLTGEEQASWNDRAELEAGNITQ